MAKGVYIGVSNLARKIKKAYIGVNTGTSEFESNFADNTWSQIIKACQMKQIPNTWKVGDQKTMTIGGTDYTIDIIGKNHDDYADGSGKAPLTLQMHEMYTGSYVALNAGNSNTTSWSGCQGRTIWIPLILANMPEEIQVAIKEVNKLTSAGGQSTNIITTADKLFLLSEIEFYGEVTYSVAGEGRQYDYYAENGRREIGWLRSPVYDSSSYFCCGSAGDYYGSRAGNSGDSKRVAPAFCFGGTSELANTPDPIIKEVARKVKKAYIGIGGVARLFFFDPYTFEDTSKTYVEEQTEVYGIQLDRPDLDLDSGETYSSYVMASDSIIINQYTGEVTLVSPSKQWIQQGLNLIEETELTYALQGMYITGASESPSTVYYLDPSGSAYYETVSGDDGGDGYGGTIKYWDIAYEVTSKIREA